MKKIPADKYPFKQVKCALPTCDARTSWRVGFVALDGTISCSAAHRDQVNASAGVQRSPDAVTKYSEQEQLQ